MIQPGGEGHLENIFAHGGEMGELMRTLDWSATPVGAVDEWPQSLKTAVSICLSSLYPIEIWWGEQYVRFYNDAYRPILGTTKHPQFLGRPGKECWGEIWDVIGPMLDSVRETGKATWSEDFPLFMTRNGYVEETYVTFSYAPLRDETGAVGGIFCACNETTERVLSERRLKTLRDLGARANETQTVAEACQTAVQILNSNPYDVPFALLYLLDGNDANDEKRARLAARTGLPLDPVICPQSIDLHPSADSPWRLAEVFSTGEAKQIVNLESQFGRILAGPWSEPLQSALVLPISQSGQEQPIGCLVTGVSSRRALDDTYRGFFDLVVGQVATTIANARTLEQERERAAALAELDRAKTIFFSNISHEFRTPLTLMLSPLEEILANPGGPLPADRQQLETVHRNSSRLLRLVNMLLDFSRIEAGRVQATYEPTDLAMLTADLVAMFRSAIDRAGLQLRVECPPLPEPVYVDREMWEKIVLNLLSNAFKFTFAGEIAVSLRWLGASVELKVCDTGIGIPEAEIPRLFERFHRVQGARGRTYEGSGIGLSLVQELVKLHGGAIQVSSQVNQGSCFTVTIPAGFAHLPQERIHASRTLESTAIGAVTYVEEALRWLPNPENAEAKTETREMLAVSPEPYSYPPWNPSAHILLADDNSDMRDYVKRLLVSQGYEVETATDGSAALAKVSQQIPDLILTDVMMPELDGLGLLRALRSDPVTRGIPVILLSARAGEESRIQGLDAGADDYLIKPFSARELLARVEATLKMAQLRQALAQREQELRVEAEVARDRVHRILESITDAFVAFDRNWRYTYVNQAAARLLQRTPDDLLGQHVWEEVFPDLVGGIAYRELHRAIVEQVPVAWEEFGEPLQRWIEVKAYPSQDGISVYFQDISARKRAEQEREQLLQREREARENAEAANRIKDEFLAVLSHELRSPLNPILGWSRLLKSRNLDEARTAQALETIERNAKLQAELITDLLDVSRILQGKLSLNVCSVDLVSTIRSAMDTVQLAAESKSIQLRAMLNPNMGRVAGDANRLQQVVWNLLTNAVKFTPSGGRVDIWLERIGTQAQITVRDTGRAISADFLPYVFDYFRQADGSTTRNFGGLGLGLAIVRHLVELHGGTVEAASAGEGQGATFTVRLPFMLASLEKSLEDGKAESSCDLSGVKLLVVDDDDDAREFATFLLEQYGAIVRSVCSAGEALTTLPQFQPDILLSDIGMPDMDGYMLMQQVRNLPAEQGGQIPAIALTAYAGELNYQQAIAAGFQIHVSKPVEPTELANVITHLLERDSS